MTYEYLCTACAHTWEAEQTISAAPLKDCPRCGQATAKRQVSGGAGFILKGGGWYADLYSSSSKGTEKKSEGDAKPAAADGAKTSEGAASSGSSSSGKKSGGGEPSGGASSKGSPASGSGGSTPQASSSAA